MINKRPNREELMVGHPDFQNKYYKQALLVNKKLPTTLKAGDYLLSTKQTDNPIRIEYSPELINEIKILFKRPENKNKFFITANSGIFGFYEDIELKEEWFNKN